MSILDGCKSVVLDEFDGVKPLLDVVDTEEGTAIVALNCKFAPGKVVCREGFTPAWVASPTFAACCQYYYSYGDPSAASANYLAWLDPGNLKLTARNLGTSTSYDIKTSLSGAPTAASFTSLGKRLYASVVAYSSYVIPLGGAFVWDGNTAHTMDDCFQRPMKTTEVTLGLTQPSAGVCTAGVHYVGVLFQTRSGYWTRPGPVNSSLVLQPQNITSTGTNNVLATLTPATTWPTWIAAVQLIYTTSLNDFQYYLIPGTITTVTPGSATVYTVSISVADLQIRSVGSQGAGTLADDYFSLLSMDASNAAPFNVKFHLAWGNRVAWFCNYGGVDSWFVSDQLNPEWITADQHIQQLPNGLPVGAAFVLRGVLYVISSAGGVYAYTDNGGRPVNFAPPQMIDSRLSCQSNSQVTVASSGGNAFVMADQGLFAYAGGMFADRPLSYYQTPDVKTYALGIAVKDFSQEQIVIVQATAPVVGSVTNLYTFNYSAGMTPEKVKASVWTTSATAGISGVADAPRIEIVRNPSTACWELWLAASLGFLRLKSSRASDVALYTDYYTNTTALTGVYAIDQQYQTSLLPQNGEGNILNHLAVRVRALQLQATVAVTSISKASFAVVTCAALHGLTSGTLLTVTISGATGTGWTGINGTWTPIVPDTTTFQIAFNSTGAGTLGGTVIVTINGTLNISVKNLDGTISVTPAVNPITMSATPGKKYLAYYDLQNEGASYLFSNGAVIGGFSGGGGLMISELAHFYNLFATER